MKTKFLGLLMYCYFLSLNLMAQQQIGPESPLYKWLGEWTIEPDALTQAKLTKEGTYYAEQLRLKIELTEDQTGVIQTSYSYVNGQYHVSTLPLFYVPELEETKGVNQFGTFSTVYPEENKEVNTFTTFMNGNQAITEIIWLSDDEATLDYRNKIKEVITPEQRSVLKRLTVSGKITLPENHKSLGQHLLATLRKIPEGPFSFTDQFMSLEGFHAIALIDTLPMASSTDKQLIQLTEMERLEMLNYASISKTVVKGQPIDWGTITYQYHTTSYYVDENSFKGEEYGDDIPCWKVELKFRYLEEDYRVMGYYFELDGKYNLIYLERDVY